MVCYHCGCQLSEHDFCTACGADVSLYKKIMSVSNYYYNEGLEKAGVRDLSGAVNSLRQSLKFNKNHVEARNLLGLVYFEMGEVVAALSEWVISKNLRPEKNIADDYIGMIQENASRLDAINQTIKKYNQAYTYCVQGSKDLALIQLKKVLSLNPRFIRAHQLLALLYLDSEQWDKARREVNKCLAIDRNNTLALRYQKELNLVAPSEEGVRTGARRKAETETGKPGKHQSDGSVRYQSDNELIIQPLNVKEPKGGSVTSLLNIGIGLIIGLAAMYFLVVPAREASVRNEANSEIARIGSQLDDKAATITELESQIETLTEEIDGLHQELDGYVGTDGTLNTIDNLLAAASSYLETQDVVQTGTNLEAIAASVDITQTSQAFQALYNTLLAQIGPQLSETYYQEGMDFYGEDRFAEAIPLLQKAVYYDAANREALYNLANAYRQNGNTQEAIAAYDKVIELFPDTDRARRAQSYKDDLTREG